MTAPIPILLSFLIQELAWTLRRFVNDLLPNGYFFSAVLTITG